MLLSQLWYDFTPGSIGVIYADLKSDGSGRCARFIEKAFVRPVTKNCSKCSLCRKGDCLTLITKTNNTHTQRMIVQNIVRSFQEV